MTLLLSLGSVAVAQQSGSEYFTDIPENAWYADYIDICYESRLMEGVGNNRFNPDGTMTCAEMLTVCARLHHIFNGGDGNIPELPPEGPRGLIYFTDTNGNNVASFDDLAEWSTSADGFVVRFEEDAMARLRGGDPMDTIILVSLIDGEKQFNGTYVLDGAGGAGYRIDIPEGGDVGVGLPDEMIYINWTSGNYTGAWYDSTMWYLGNVLSIGLTDELEDAVDEMTEIIESDYPEMNTSDFSGVEADCPRAMLALFLAACIPEEHLTRINDIGAVPDLNAEIVRKLYSAGILGGVDEYGTFDGHGTLTRAQMAAVVTRVVKPELRLKLTFKEPEYQDTLVVYNWGEYMDPSLLKPFTNNSGIKVEYHTHSTSGDLYAILKSGARADVIITEDHMLDRLRMEEMLRKLDNPAGILNNLDRLPGLETLPFDPAGE